MCASVREKPIGHDVNGLHLRGVTPLALHDNEVPLLPIYPVLEIALGRNWPVRGDTHHRPNNVSLALMVLTHTEVLVQLGQLQVRSVFDHHETSGTHVRHVVQ